MKTSENAFDSSSFFSGDVRKNNFIPIRTIQKKNQMELNDVTIELKLDHNTLFPHINEWDGRRMRSDTLHFMLSFLKYIISFS